MLSLAMIRVEPGSTPGIGITITEHFFFVFCAMFFCFFARGELVACHLAAAAVLKFFSILLLHTYRYLVLGTTYYYIKSDNVDKEHGHTGGTYLIFPPSWPPLPT